MGSAGLGLGLQLLRYFSYIGMYGMAAKFTVATDVGVCVCLFVVFVFCDAFTKHIVGS